MSETTEKKEETVIVPVNVALKSIGAGTWKGTKVATFATGRYLKNLGLALAGSSCAARKEVK